MSEAQLQTFKRRTTRISRSHRRLSRGSKTAVTKSGLIVQRPTWIHVSFPWRSALTAALIVLAVKAVIHVSIGAEAYDARVERMALGNTVERAAAWVMYPDPATLWLSERFAVSAATFDDAE